MEAPTAFDLYQLTDRMKEMHAAMRLLAEAGGTAGQWGAVRFLESVVYYMHGAAAWLTVDMSDQEKVTLEEQLELISPHAGE